MKKGGDGDVKEMVINEGIVRSEQRDELVESKHSGILWHYVFQCRS